MCQVCKDPGVPAVCVAYLTRSGSRRTIASPELAVLWKEIPLCRAPQSPPRILAQDNSAGWGATPRGGSPAAYEGDPVIYIVLYGLNGVEKAPL